MTHALKKSHLNEALEDSYKLILRLMRSDEATVTMANAYPSKRETLKCLWSKAYALEHHPDLESMKAFDFLLQITARTLRQMVNDIIDSEDVMTVASQLDHHPDYYRNRGMICDHIVHARWLERIQSDREAR